MVTGRVRKLPEIHASTARNPELPPGSAVLGIDPSAENDLGVQPTRAQEKYPADSETSHLPEASDEQGDPAVTIAVPSEGRMCLEDHRLPPKLRQQMRPLNRQLSHS